MLREIRPSEIKLFKRCRRQWNLKYNIGIPEKAAATARLGTVVHKALQNYYCGDDWEAPILAYEGEDQDWAHTMVAGYLQWLAETGADAGVTVEGVEKTLRVRLPDQILGDTIELVGHIDLLATDAHNRRLLIDHKTVQSLDQYSRQLQVDDQMLTYAVMLRLGGIKIDGAIHNAIKRSKRTARATPPFYQRNEVKYGTPQLRTHYTHLVGVLTDMVRLLHELAPAQLGGNGLYPTPTKDCTWDCPFLGICAAHDDGSDIEGIVGLLKQGGQ